MYEDYAELQFVERNAATVDRRDPNHPSGRTVHPRTFVPASRYPSQPQVIYAQGPGFGASNLLGRMTTGDVINMAAQIFAALMPLPAAPVSTTDTATDVGNLMLYQGAIASYAKRDEQIRTLGSLITKLVG